MTVKDAVRAANHPAVSRRISEAEARREVVPVGMNKRAVEQRAVFRQSDSPGARIEVGELIVVFDDRRGVFVTQPVVQGQFLRELEIILKVQEMQPLRLIEDGVAGQLQLRRQGEQRVADRTAREKTIVENQTAYQRVDVADACIHEDQLAAVLHKVAAEQI